MRSKRFVYLKDIAEINKTIPKMIIVTLDAKPNRFPLPPEMAKRYEKDIITDFTHSSYCGISHVLILRESQLSFFSSEQFQK